MDNFFQNCPPMMEDQGRQLGDYKTATRRNEYIKYINDIWRDDQYRLFLQSNGKEIMEREYAYHKKNNRCWANECVHNYPLRVSPRHMAQEMEAYNSVWNLKTNERMQPLRQCEKWNDFRLNPKI